MFLTLFPCGLHFLRGEQQSIALRLYVEVVFFSKSVIPCSIRQLTCMSNAYYQHAGTQRADAFSPHSSRKSLNTMKEKHTFESRRDVNASPGYTRNGFDDCLHKKCWFNVIKMHSGIWYKNCNLPWSTRDYLQRSSATIWLQTTGIIVRLSEEGTKKRDKTSMSVRANLRMKV